MTVPSIGTAAWADAPPDRPLKRARGPPIPSYMRQKNLGRGVGHRLSAGLVALAAAGLVACGGGNGAQVVDGSFSGIDGTPLTGDAAPAGDAPNGTLDGPAPTGDAPALPPGVCGPGMVRCGSECTDPKNDPENCGVCGALCAVGRSCVAGVCQLVCSPGQIVCGGRCVDPLTDLRYCGAAGTCEGPNVGTSCRGAETCVNGACTVNCPAGHINCNGFCVDPNSDRTRCGASGDCQGVNAGVACTGSRQCIGGLCAIPCPAGQMECNGICIDPLSNRTYCGASGDCQGVNRGRTCVGQELCSAGSCLLTCTAGRLNCGGSCIDPNTDRTRCGATGDCQGANAGRTCVGAQTCMNGRCALTCPAGQIDCNGRCVDPMSDRLNCGASGDCQGANAGASCLAGEVCAAGTCSTTCPGTLSNCSLMCVDTTTSASHCGGCNMPVGAGRTCCGGKATSTLTDAANCGVCGNACPMGTTCCAGKCSTLPVCGIQVAALNQAWTGNLGGIDMADAHCQMQAAAAGVAGTWKAFLSATNRNVKDLVPPDLQSLPVYNLKGEKLLDSWMNLNQSIPSSLLYIWTFSGIQVDEGKVNPDWFDADAWTGSDAMGNWAMGATCNDWTDGTATGGSGRATELDLGGNIFTKQETKTCSTYAAVMCVLVGP